MEGAKKSRAKDKYVNIPEDQHIKYNCGQLFNISELKGQVY